jgi:ketosteroid isomerase-like protein
MNEQPNTRTVLQGYAFFSQGDIASLLNLYTEDIEFNIPGPLLIPYSGVSRGKEEVSTFFAKIHEAVEFERFEAQECIEQGDTVVALGYAKARARATGKTEEEEWAHVLRMRDGKVAHFQVFTDTAAVAQAFQRSNQMA